MARYRLLTVSGKVAVGTSTLAKALAHNLNWDFVSGGELQREYHRKQGIDSSKTSALINSDDHERQIDNLAVELIKNRINVVYEAWLAGFFAYGYPDVGKILLICSNDAVRIDRLANRENMTIEEAKNYLRQREQGNIEKWTHLYGKHDFWDARKYDLVIDTFTCSPKETLEKALKFVQGKS